MRTEDAEAGLDAWLLPLLVEGFRRRAAEGPAVIPSSGYPLSRPGVSRGLRVGWEPQDDGAFSSCVPVRFSDPGDRLKVVVSPRTRRQVALAVWMFSGLPGADGVSSEVGTAAALVEALFSSRIENMRAPVADVARAALGGPRTMATDVATNYHALRYRPSATEPGAAEQWTRDVKARHELLIADPFLHPGCWRTERVWIGGWHPRTAVFNPPHPDRVSDAMADLGAYASRVPRRNTAAVVDAALVHGQFETIHPFADGNGRIGRALIGDALDPSGVGVVLPISCQLWAGKDLYYAALGEYRRGDANPLICLVAEAIVQATTVVAGLARDSLADDRAVGRRGIGALAQVGLTPDAVGEAPAWSASSFAARAGVSMARARAVLEAVSADGDVLLEGPRVRGARVWSNLRVLGLVAAAAGS